MAVSTEAGTLPYMVADDVDAEHEPDPERIGRYRITGRIGSGGAAVVHAAHDPVRGPVAVKVLRPAASADPAYRRRFAREAALLSRVDARHTAALVDADLQAPRPWLAMRHVLGPTVGDLVDADGPMTGVRLLEFAAGVAGALAAIHAAGIVHRDLKPGNVLLTSDGPRVIDFGIAHTAGDAAVAGPGQILGSPGWISPEQFHNHVPGPAADVFAWGELVAYAATGRHPFGQGTVRDTATRALNGQADLRGVPRLLLPWVEATLDTDPVRRPTSAETAAVVGELATGRTRRCGVGARPRAWEGGRRVHRAASASVGGSREARTAG